MHFRSMHCYLSEPNTRYQNASALAATLGEKPKGELIATLLNPSQLKSWMKPVDPVDVWLDHQGLYRKHTARDASCLYRIIAEQVYLTQMFHMNVRKQCVDFALKNPKFLKRWNLSSQEVVDHLQNLRETSGDLEINVLAIIYKRDFVLHKEIGHPPSLVTNYGYKQKMNLWVSKDSHYDSVHTKQHIANAAFCQALIYEVLYKRVFKLQEVDFAVNKMLHDKVTRYPREVNSSYGYAMRLEMREQCLNAKDLLKMDITPFPYKVAKSLDPNIYRNVEFDTWNEGRRGYRLTYWSNRELKVGAKCLVTMNPETVHVAHIQRMSENHGPVTIFVEALGQMLTVPFEKLSLLPEIRSSLNNYQEKCLQSEFSHAGSDDYDDNDYPDNSLYCGPLSESSTDAPQVYQISSSSDHFQERNHDDKESTQQYSYENDNEKPLSAEQNQVSNNYDKGYAEKCDSVTNAPSPNERQDQSSLMNLIDNVAPVASYSPPPPCDTSNNQQSNSIVNLAATESVMLNGSDLPLSDIPTVRFFFNLGVSYLRSCNTMVCPPSPCLPYSYYCGPVPGTPGPNCGPSDVMNNSRSLPAYAPQPITLSAVPASFRQRRDTVVSNSGALYVSSDSDHTVQTISNNPQNVKIMSSPKYEGEPLMQQQVQNRFSGMMQPQQPSTPPVFGVPGTPPPNNSQLIPLTPGGMYTSQTPVFYAPAECPDSPFYSTVGYVDCACIPSEQTPGVYQTMYPQQFTFPPEPVMYQHVVPQSPIIQNSYSG